MKLFEISSRKPNGTYGYFVASDSSYNARMIARNFLKKLKAMDSDNQKTRYERIPDYVDYETIDDMKEVTSESFIYPFDDFYFLRKIENAINARPFIIANLNHEEHSKEFSVIPNIEANPRLSAANLIKDLVVRTPELFMSSNVKKTMYDNYISKLAGDDVYANNLKPVEIDIECIICMSDYNVGIIPVQNLMAMF